MTQCQEQADAVIKRLEDTKFKLLQKRDQLRKSLAFAWDNPLNPSIRKCF